MTNRNPLLYHAASSYYSMIARYALLLAGEAFESRVMDIHKKREQLKPWYAAINPAMTVPTLIDASRSFNSSKAILDHAVQVAPDRWLENCCSQSVVSQVQRLVELHYCFEVERLTFNALMEKLPPLRVLFPMLLRKVSKSLQAQMQQPKADTTALEAKIAVTQSRIDYFARPLAARQAEQIELAKQLIAAFPAKPAGSWLFGELPSRADVVLLVFLARLSAIGLNNASIVAPPLSNWFKQKTHTSAFLKADVWVKFHPWRLITHR